MTTLRGKILDAAKNLTEGDRNESYGSPETGMRCFGDLVHSYLVSKQNFEITPVDAAVIMVLLKVSRVVNDPSREDTFIDMAAYAAIAGEMAAIAKTR